MLRLPKAPHISLLIPFVVSLVACGGGGGGGGGGEKWTVVQSIELKQANAPGVASEAVLQLEATAFTTETLLQVLGNLSFPVGITSSNCNAGGSEDVEFRDNDNNQILSSGDVLILRDRHCSSGGVLSQGDVTINYSFIGSGQAGTTARHTGTIAFTDFKSSYTQSGQNIYGFDGELSFDYEIPAALNSTHAFSINSLGTKIEISFGDQRGSLQITQASLLERQVSNDFEVKIDATYMDSSRQGSVDISTGSSSGLSGAYGQYPTAGVIKIIGAHGSEVRLIPNPVISTPYLAFSLDEQGQGVFSTLVLTPSPVWEDYSLGFFVRAAY